MEMFHWVRWLFLRKTESNGRKSPTFGVSNFRIGLQWQYQYNGIVCVQWGVELWLDPLGAHSFASGWQSKTVEAKLSTMKLESISYYFRLLLHDAGSMCYLVNQFGIWIHKPNWWLYIRGTKMFLILPIWQS